MTEYDERKSEPNPIVHFQENSQDTKFEYESNNNPEI